MQEVLFTRMLTETLALWPLARIVRINHGPIMGQGVADQFEKICMQYVKPERLRVQTILNEL